MHKCSAFIKGMAAGIAVGAAVTMITDPISERERRKITKKTEGIFKNIGSAVDSVVGMFH